MIDEIYTACRVEYSNGSFIGLTEEGVPAKTVLAFMVQSMRSNYKDVVCLVPVNKLDTAILRRWFDTVMTAIFEVMLVLTVSVDNHVCNRYYTLSTEFRCSFDYRISCSRKLLVELSGQGEICSSIDHPIRSNEKLFLLFDFTHNFKNTFNHFANKKVMHPPCQGHHKILGSACSANFKHIIKLYALEEHKSLKVAHSLKKVSLNPSSVARTSPMHALSELLIL